MLDFLSIHSMPPPATPWLHLNLVLPIHQPIHQHSNINFPTNRRSRLHCQHILRLWPWISIKICQRTCAPLFIPLENTPCRRIDSLQTERRRLMGRCVENSQAIVFSARFGLGDGHERENNRSETSKHADQHSQPSVDILESRTLEGGRRSRDASHGDEQDGARRGASWQAAQ